MSGMEPDMNSPVLGMHLWGWMSPTELSWLYEQAKTMTNIVEIGSLVGRSSFALLSGCPGLVYCIDPWTDDDLRQFMSGVGHFPNLVPIRACSPAAGGQVPGEIDMVFVDGNHDYESCKADLEYWFPRTKKLICGHDYTHPAYPGVRQSVDEFFGKLGGKVEILENGSIWIVRLT